MPPAQRAGLHCVFLFLNCAVKVTEKFRGSKLAKLRLDRELPLRSGRNENRGQPIPDDIACSCGKLLSSF